MELTQTRCRSQALCEDRAHWAHLRLMAFQSAPVCWTPLSHHIPTTQITYLEIKPCLIKHINVSAMVGTIWEMFRLSGFFMHIWEMILHLTWFCSLQWHVLGRHPVSFSPCDFIFLQPICSILDLFTKADWEPNPLAFIKCLLTEISFYIVIVIEVHHYYMLYLSEWEREIELFFPLIEFVFPSFFPPTSCLPSNCLLLSVESLSVTYIMDRKIIVLGQNLNVCNCTCVSAFKAHVNSSPINI